MPRCCKDGPLIAYYDDVPLKGLQLAATDAQRRVLHGDALETMKTSVQDVVDDLGKAHGDAPKAPGPKGNADVPTLAEQELPRPAATPAIV